MANIREISGNTIGNNVTIVQGDLNTANPSSPDSIDAFLNKISKTDPFYDKKRILELKGPLLHESFNWILDHEGFKKWRHTKESSVLWIKGDPGKGKTMLLCGIIEDLKKNPSINSNLGYFFCQATDSRINSASSVIAGLIFSLIERRPTVLLPIREEYKDKLGQLDGPNSWVVLCEIFEAVTHHPTMSGPVCVVDALDECEHDCKLLLSLIVETSAHVKWLISSRNVKDIERALRLLEASKRLSLELKENAENVSKSVDAYINNSIKDVEALQGDKQLQIRTAKALKSKASGTFLWVALVIEQLRDTDHRNVEEVLDEMPEGLENLYDLILRRANSKLRKKDQEACLILLSIVTTAERPLHLEELHLFIRSQWEHYKPTYDLRDIKDLVKDCGSFLSVRNDTVYFIHQSVKDYMVGNAAERIFPSGIEYQHYQMAEISLTAMSRGLKHNIYDLKDPKSDLADITRPNPDPLKHLKYCCLFWVEHLLRGGSKTDQLLTDDGILHTFLKSNYLSWLESLALLRGLLSQGRHALNALKNLVISYHGSKAIGQRVGILMNSRRKDGTDSLKMFIDDAYHFFHFCKGYVSRWPLQLYFSAILFEDNDSAVSRTFQQTVNADIGESLSLINKPQQRHFLLYNTEPKDRGSIRKIIFSLDSSLLCVLSGYDTVSLYKADTGSLKCVIEMDLGTNNNVDKFHPVHVAFSSDSRSLISISHAGLVRTWTDDGALEGQLTLNLEKDIHGCDINNFYYRDYGERVINLSPNGDLAASECNMSEKKLLRIWTTKTGAQMFEIDLLGIHGFLFSQMVAFFSPNSALVVVVHKYDVIIYSTQTGKELKYIHEPRENATGSSKFSSDSKLLVIISRSNIHLWCTTTWTRRRIATQVKITYFDLSPDGEVFVAASPEQLIFGNMTTGQKLFKIPFDSRWTYFYPNWTNFPLLASHSDWNIKIWQIERASSLARNQDTSDAISVIISPNSTYVATFPKYGDTITIWGGESGQCVQTLKRTDSFWTYPVFSPNSELIAYEDGTQGDVTIWDISARKSLHLLKGPGGDFIWPTMVFSGDSKCLLVGHEGGEVRIWCIESGKRLYISQEKHEGSRYRTTIPNLAISRNSKYIGVVYGKYDWDTWRVRIWDWRAGYRVSLFNINCFAKNLDFSSDDRRLVAVYKTSSPWQRDQYEVQIWIVATGVCLSRVTVGESYSLPLFDPATDQILTDRFSIRRFSFRQNSSWEHWNSVPRRGYSLHNHKSHGFWICVGGEKSIRIPKEYSPCDESAVAVSASLIVFVTSSYGLIIIRLPNRHDLRRKRIEASYFYDASKTSLVLSSEISTRRSNYNLWERDEAGPSQPKSKRMKLS